MHGNEFSSRLEWNLFEDEKKFVKWNPFGFDCLLNANLEFILHAWIAVGRN